MIRNMLFHISVVLLIIGCGKYEDSIENPSPNNILVEVEAPQAIGLEHGRDCRHTKRNNKNRQTKRRIRLEYGSEYTVLPRRICNR